MKLSIFQKSILFLVAILFFGSCDKNTNSSEVKFTAEIGGTNFTGKSQTGVIGPSGVSGISKVSITANSEQNSRLEFDLPNFVGEATYTIASGGCQFTPDIANTSLYYPSNDNISNSLMVSNWNDTDSTISGYFSLYLRKTADTVIFVDKGVFKNVRLNQNPSANNQMSMKLDDQVWNVSSDMISASSQLGTILIVATEINNGARNFQLSMNDQITVGDWGLNSSYLSSVTLQTDLKFYDADSGSLIVTLHDKENSRISGLLNFEMVSVTDTISITDGTFDIRYGD